MPMADEANESCVFVGDGGDSRGPGRADVGGSHPLLGTDETLKTLVLGEPKIVQDAGDAGGARQSSCDGILARGQPRRHRTLALQDRLEEHNKHNCKMVLNGQHSTDVALEDLLLSH